MKQNIYLKNILSDFNFNSMNIAKLRLHLKDEYSYQDTENEISKNEIESIFKAYKNSREIELLFYIILLV